MFYNIRRYTTGLDTISPDPGANAEWWWPGAPAPLVVWIVGTLSFGILVVLLARSASIGSRFPATAIIDVSPERTQPS
ncbi:hypothetical protein [Microbacterium sp. CH12i]|uniref:hypothetical protein n=1 Tax=Microbacterium sp. CH12i TaxID=1479651 RepID=UPI000B2E9A48|nr:hypothetical protein [Microbacterium sp. CH12i]